MRHTGNVNTEAVSLGEALRRLKPGQAILDLGRNSGRMGVAFYWEKGEPEINGFLSDEDFLIIDLPNR